jgi:hypothetical protein
VATLNARDVLRQNGYEVGNRGRFSREQMIFLNTKGFNYDIPAENAPVAKTDSNATLIRAWALDNNIPCSERGKLSTALKTAYAANDPALAVVINVNKPAREKKAEGSKVIASNKPLNAVTRTEAEAFAIDDTGVAIGFVTCGKCNNAVKRCSCVMPSVPSYFPKIMRGTITVSMTRPEKRNV